MPTSKKNGEETKWVFSWEEWGNLTNGLCAIGALVGLMDQDLSGLKEEISKLGKQTNGIKALQAYAKKLGCHIKSLDCAKEKTKAILRECEEEEVTE